ncbi:MAG: signal transduction histidine kinase, LytS [Oscillospiraceae bacterium]|nr:signal transduction histidine kinase, LytS [Oscillospiraceae bacterium]
MKQTGLKKIELKTIFATCFILQILLCAAILVLCLAENAHSHHRVTIVLSMLVLLISLLILMFFFQRMLWPMDRIDAKLNRICEEMPGDPFWQDIGGVDTTGYVLRHIDELFERVKAQSGRDYQAELLNRQAEFSALQSQINPHFLYNTLDSIRGQALIDGADEIAEMTEALSTFFRYSISQKGAMVTLAEEIKNVENYFFIQQFRFSNRFDYSIVAEDPAALSYYIPKLTLQPIVENSIFHGLESKLEKGHIAIRVTMTEKRLLIDVTDDGIGMDKATLEHLRSCLERGVPTGRGQGRRGTGTAVSNVNQRIRLFFGPVYGVTISSTPLIGTNVQVVIPLISDPAPKGGTHD